MEKNKPENSIFILDIGTRSVIGILGYSKDDVFCVTHVDKEEYKKRVVVDGQIDDISQTANTAKIVKKRIEDKCGFKLTNVYIAAAGRSLKTINSSAKLDIDVPVIGTSFNKKLEFTAVQKAIEKISEERNYYYVGHTVQKYELDDYEISSIMDHRGKVAKVHMIVTFLPEEVVESLCSTMKILDLTVSGLTLEPIAAMNAIIPSELRKLNLVLCDIGAGTSDIAVCNEGSVIGYTMATIAGDEVSESIMQNLLVDFIEAEQIKKKLGKSEIIEYTNILGMKEEISSEDICLKISDVIKKLANTIAQNVLEINAKPPAAVFLVGGASQTPGLSLYLAQALGLEEKLVSVGSSVYMKKMISSKADVFTPEFATPLGIALTAIGKSYGDTFSVKVNSKDIHLYNIWDTTAFSVLQSAGYRYNQIIGKSGSNISVYINSERKLIRGGIPTPSQIIINGTNASLSDIVKPGDRIEFAEAVSGKDADILLFDLVPKGESFDVNVNGKPISVGRNVSLNGSATTENQVIKKDDRISVTEVLTLGQLFMMIEDKPSKYHWLVNGEKQEKSYLLKPKDNVQIFVAKQNVVKPIDALTIEEQTNGDAVEEFNESAEEEINSNIGDATPNNHEKIRIILNDEELFLEPKKNGDSYLFFDLFIHANIDPKESKGDLYMGINGNETQSFLHEVKDGDTIEIFWIKREI